SSWILSHIGNNSAQVSNKDVILSTGASNDIMDVVARWAARNPDRSGSTLSATDIQNIKNGPDYVHFRQNVTRQIDTLMRSGASRVFIMGVETGPENSPDYVHHSTAARVPGGVYAGFDVNGDIKQIVDQYKLAHPDQASRISFGGPATRPSEDGIHPSTAGYHAIMNAASGFFRGAPASAVDANAVPANDIVPVNYTAPASGDTADGNSTAADAAAACAVASTLTGSNFGPDQYLFADTDLIKALQQKLGLPVTGIADADTVNGLKQMIASKVPGYTPSADGDFGADDVCALQTMLKSSGNYSADGRADQIDGKFGNHSQNALRHFLGLEAVAEPAPSSRFYSDDVGGAPTYHLDGAEVATAPTGAVNVDSSVNFLQTHDCMSSRGECAKYVRLALEHAGYNLANHPYFAKDYAEYFDRNPQLGINRVQGWTPANAQIGDIAVFGPQSGHGAGHIEIFTGYDKNHQQVWRSDFASGFYAAHAYANAGPSGYAIYRMGTPPAAGAAHTQVASRRPSMGMRA
ncbi:MAG TPA: peptidoglycan-binding domain-containing protein, partial [Alphaproteobacteria bacterium]|nr:peptidoglycan-binding domain-containing protein [Alphaproteobacteria bacterium]